MANHDDHAVEELAPTPGQRATGFMKRNDVARTTALFLAWTVLFLVLGKYFYPKWMPVIMSKEMKSAESIMIWFTYISAPIAGIVLAISTNSFLNAHRGDTPPPDGPAIRTNGPVVMLWTIGSFLFALVAIVWGLLEVNSQAVAAGNDAKSAITVEVTGSQWLWTFNYPAQGIETHDLNLPVGVPVIFDVKSADVNHSFWPVQLGVKVDANSQVTTVIHTTPTMVGPIEVKCAELCGLYHAYMETNGAVMSKSDFNAWVTAQGGHTA
jgi:cytochrome c oxidase subunit 2